MAYHLIITSVAEQNVADACVYYETQHEGLSERFLDELQMAFDKIVAHPLYYSFISPDHHFRDIKIIKFPFVVIYEIVENAVIVIAVFNTHRKPLV